MPGRDLNLTCSCLASDQADRQGPWSSCYELSFCVCCFNTFYALQRGGMEINEVKWNDVAPTYHHSVTTAPWQPLHERVIFNSCANY